MLSWSIKFAVAHHINAQNLAMTVLENSCCYEGLDVAVKSAST